MSERYITSATERKKMIDKKRIFEILNEKGIEYVNYEHKPVYTVSEMHELDIPNLDMCLKNLFLKDKKGSYYIVSLFGHKSINLKELKGYIGSSALHFGSVEDLEKITGLKPGHVTPFGILNSSGYNMKAVFDRELEGKTVGIHPMLNDATLFIRFEDLKKLIDDMGFEVVMYDETDG